MKRNVWGLSWTNLKRWSALRLSLLLVASPAVLSVVVMFSLPEHGANQLENPNGETQRLVTLQRWQQSLPGSVTYDRSGFATLAKTPPDFSSAVWATVTIPDTLEMPAQSSAKSSDLLARAWFRYSYTVPSNAETSTFSTDPYSLYITRIMGGSYALWVNDELVATRLDDWRIIWAYPLLLSIPAKYMKPGQTLDIALAVPYRVNQGYALGSVYTGRASALQPSYDTRYFLQHTLPVIGMFLVGLMGVLSFCMWLQRRDEKTHGLLALLSVAVVICNLQFIHDFSIDDARSVWFGAIVDAATVWMLLLFFIFALRFSQLCFPKTELYYIIFTTLGMAVTLPLWNWQVSGLILYHYCTIAFFIFSTCLLAWQAAAHKQIETGVLAFASAVFIAAGIHDVTRMTSQIAPDGIYFFPYGSFLLYLSAEFLLKRRYVQALHTIAISNTTLNQKLKAQEQQLLAQQAQLIAAQRQQALMQERERMVQDIHDGIGSALINSRANLEDGKATVSEAVVVIQHCLDDLKIVIESLEPEAHDLAALLGALRYRFNSRLQTAGLQLMWEMSDLPLLPWLDAPQALDVLRVVQEIISNTLKHAQASELKIFATVEAGQVDKADVILLVLQDNGKGFDSACVNAGRGLKHIRMRLSRINANLKMCSMQDSGVRYEIRFPITK